MDQRLRGGTGKVKELLPSGEEKSETDAAGNLVLRFGGEAAGTKLNTKQNGKKRRVTHKKTLPQHLSNGANCVCGAHG